MGNLTGMLGLFTALINVQDDVKDGSNNRVRNYIGCAMIDCTEKNDRLLFFVMIIFMILFYEGCSNMNASSFITFFTYMLLERTICRL